MVRIRLSPSAERDIEQILRWTHQEFGESIRLRWYEELLIQAILDLSEDPNRAGNKQRPELSSEARTYHLLNSRNRVSRSVGRIRKPRHFLVYRVVAEGEIQIGRVLHKSMDFIQHLPPEYQPEESDCSDKTDSH